MWELNLFKRIVPAFALTIMAVVLYMITNYVVDGLFDAFNSSGYDPSTWGLASWLFAGMGIIVIWFYLLRAWLVIKGRISGGLDEPRTRSKKPEAPPVGPMPPY